MSQYSLDEVTIGIITALAEEFTATCELLGCHTPVHCNGRIYHIGSLKRYDWIESHVVVVCRTTDMGTSTAAARTSLMLKDCKNIKVVGMCGIAGAIPNPIKASDHVRLGDIVVAKRNGVIQYDNIKESEDGSKMRSRIGGPNQKIVSACAQLTSYEQLGEKPWEKYIEAGIESLVKKGGRDHWKRPSENNDQLREFTGRIRDRLVFAANFIGIKSLKYHPIPHPIDDLRTVSQPRVFLGVIASANNLLKNPKRRNFLRDTYDAKAVEMEGIGVADAAYEAELDFFLVRGTCDYCNGDKNDDWHFYAAIAAAAYTRALLEVLPTQQILTQSSTSNTSPAMKTETVHTKAGHSNSEAKRAVIDKEELNDLNLIMTKALITQTNQSIQKIEILIDSLEIKKAIEEADKLESTLRTGSTFLPIDLVSKAYEWLARITITKAKMNGTQAQDSKKIQELIAKARGNHDA